MGATVQGIYLFVRSEMEQEGYLPQTDRASASCHKNVGPAGGVVDHVRKLNSPGLITMHNFVTVSHTVSAMWSQEIFSIVVSWPLRIGSMADGGSLSGLYCQLSSARQYSVIITIIIDHHYHHHHLSFLLYRFRYSVFFY